MLCRQRILTNIFWLYLQCGSRLKAVARILLHLLHLYCMGWLLALPPLPCWQTEVATDPLRFENAPLDVMTPAGSVDEGPPLAGSSSRTMFKLSRKRILAFRIRSEAQWSRNIFSWMLDGSIW